jgi:hypothetical protein
MFWALVGIGVAGALLSTLAKVHAIAVTSAILVLVAPTALLLTGHGVVATMTFTLGAITILQACYLVGLFCAARFRSSVRHEQSPQSTR